MIPAKRKSADDNSPCAKKQKNRTSKIEKSNLFALNDDCLREIMDRLTLDDLCSLSQTCRRLFNLSSDTFSHRYPNEQLECQFLQTQDDALLKYPECENYALCFSEVRKVSLASSVSSVKCIKSVTQLFQSKPLEEIQFENWRPLRPSHGQSFADVSENIKAVSFSNVKISGGFHRCILHYLPSLERLTLWNKFDEETNDWHQQSYSNLQYFAWHLNEELNVDTFHLFIGRNPTIAHFSVLSSNIETVVSCMNIGINITELHLKIKANLSTTLTELRNFCIGSASRRLHLLIEDNCRDELSKNLKLLIALAPNIDGLYFENKMIGMKLADTISRFVELKFLQLKATKNVHALFSLPKLEELYISRAVTSSNFGNIRDTINWFASESLTLKKIYFRNNAQPFAEFQFPELDLNRRTLNGAANLTIYVNTRETDNSGPLSSINLTYETVNIKHYKHSSRIINPLMNEYLYAKEGACARHYFTRS